MEDSEIRLLATAKEGDNHSNNLLLNIDVSRGGHRGLRGNAGHGDRRADAEAVLKVNIAGGRQGNINVAYELSPKIAKPAMPGEDYDGSSGTLTFGTDDRKRPSAYPSTRTRLTRRGRSSQSRLPRPGAPWWTRDRATAVVTIVDEHPG